MNLLNSRGLIDNDVIIFLKEDKSCGHNLLKKKIDFTEKEIEYGRYKKNVPPELIYRDDEFYVARNWGINNVPKFILKFTERFPGLEYETS